MDRARKIYRYMLFFILLLSLLLIGFLGYRIKKMIPDQILLRKGQTEELNIGIPVSAVILRSPVEHGNRAESREMAQMIHAEHGKAKAELTTPVVSAFHMTSDTGTSYEMQLRFLGIIPLKTVQMQTVAEQNVLVSGKPIGIYLKTPGVLVIDTGAFAGNTGEQICPADGILQSGDYVMQIDHTDLEGKKDFVNRIKNSNGAQMILTIRRNGEMSEVRITPAQCEEGIYKIGVWVRDSAQGIGTMTYETADGHFGALGHGIADADIGELLALSKGSIYDTSILAVHTSDGTKPGELTGVLSFEEEDYLGRIEENTEAGIYGSFCKPSGSDSREDAITETSADTSVENDGAETMKYPIALKQEVREGAAQIYTSFDGTGAFYDIEITRLRYEEDSNQNITLTVTDPELLAKTGGIVQGMSGSPILQNGKIVGAVTHVLVKQPEKGYGIFIENMLAHN